MGLGVYGVIIEATGGFLKPIDFTIAIVVFIYAEPPLSSLILLNIFLNKRRKLFRSYSTLREACDKLKEMSPVSLKFARIVLVSCCVIFVVDTTDWLFLVYFTRRPIGETVYEGLSYGIALKSQSVMVVYFIVHMTISFSVFAALNLYLSRLRSSKLYVNKEQLVERLKLVGKIHGDLCKAHGEIANVCAPIVLTFLFRFYFLLTGSLLSINTVFDGGNNSSWYPIFTFATVCFFVSLMNDALHNQVEDILI